MEYMAFADDVMTGGQLNSLKGALPYDQEAVEFAYFGKKLTKRITPITPNG